MYKFLLLVILGSCSLKIMDISKYIKTGEQIVFEINGFNIFKIRKQPIILHEESLFNYYTTKRSDDICLPEEENLYRKIQEMKDTIEKI